MNQERSPAGLQIRELETVGEIGRAFDLFNELWGGETGAVPINVIKAMAHARNCISGAWDGDHLVGASLAFAWGDLEARSLHSHISGVLEGWQGRGIGYDLKLHQRTWAAEHGYETITWTFDPLVRRNGCFNLAKLGVRVEEYQPDFYGPMDDGINAGDPTDRCLAAWDVHPPRDPGDCRPAHPPLELLRCAPGDLPDVHEAGWKETDVLSCQVPGDIIAIRRSDPGLALRWRHALRETMGAAIQGGFVTAAITRDGCYILERNQR